MAMRWRASRLKKLPDYVYAHAERADLLGRTLRLFFQDEARFGRINDPRRCWAPAAVRPVVDAQHIREYLYAFAAVSPHDGQLTSLITDQVDANTMSIFLALVAAEYPNDEILMVLDGAGWHRANALRVPPSMHLLFLPPYSPQLNPVENLWDDLREKHFTNRCFPSLTAVRDALCIALRELHHDHQRTQSITGFPWITAL